MLPTIASLVDAKLPDVTRTCQTSSLMAYLVEENVTFYYTDDPNPEIGICALSSIQRVQSSLLPTWWTLLKYLPQYCMPWQLLTAQTKSTTSVQLND